METQRGARLRLTSRLLIAVVVAFLPIVAPGQEFNHSNVDLPRGPAKPGFDISRFNSTGKGWFQTFHVKQTEPLRDALKTGKVAEDTRLLVTDVATGKLALITDQMAYHHLAQGSAGGKDWLVTF